jgi:xylan 1,4-beta-xylosidase
VSKVILGCPFLMIAGLFAPFRGMAVSDSPVESLTISPSSPESPLPHFWEQMFGSGRAILSLRDDYRRNLRSVKSVTDLRYVRFHNIFADEVGLYSLDSGGRAVFNYSYVDQIYDGLLENGVRPFVEISFMPLALASDSKSSMSFWYHPNRSPPKSYDRWDDLVRHFAAHLVERYGIDEVSQWYFEVWNEPNIDFWAGKPKQRTYFELYAHTSRDLKSVSRRLRVGGPATAQAAWVSEFLRFTGEAGVTPDFISSHVYGDDTAENVFGTHEVISRDQLVCRAVAKMHEEIANSPFPTIPLILSEYNASYSNKPEVTDTTYMGPWMANTIRQCAGMVDMMSYWTFSDVFEEQGVVKTPFHGGFGLIAERNIPKPAYNAFSLLHKLGDRRIAVASDSALVTKRADGTLAIALWNYADPQAANRTEQPAELESPRPAKRFKIRLENAAMRSTAKIWRVDADHGNVIRAFDSMGRPDFPSTQQIDDLNAAAQLPDPEARVLREGALEVMVPVQGLALIEIPPQP